MRRFGVLKKLCMISDVSHGDYVAGILLKL